MKKVFIIVKKKFIDYIIPILKGYGKRYETGNY